MSRSLLLLVIIALFATLAVRRPWRGASRTPEESPFDTSDADRATATSAPAVVPATQRGSLARQLERWRRAGIITDDQAAAITRLAVREPVPPRASRSAVVAETVGYVGGILAVVGLGLIVARYWANLNTPVRLVGSGVLALALGLGGGRVAEAAGASWQRLRWFLWLASTAAAGLFAFVATRAVASPAPRAEVVVLVTALVVGVLSFALWRGRFRPIQEMTTLGAGVVALGAVSRLVGTPTWMSVGVWVGAAIVLALSIGRLVPTRIVAEIVGAFALLVAAIMLLNHSTGPGGLLNLVGAVALLAVAASPRVVPARADAILLAVTGAVVIAQSAPVTLSYFAERAGLVTGGLVWLVGASGLLVGATMPMRAERLTRWVGSLSMLGGAAIIAGEYPDRAPIAGLVTAVGLLALGARPGELGESVIGAVGLLVNVPWLIIRLFPGQVRAPLVTLITGVLFVALALVLAREHAHAPHGHAPRRRLRH